MGILVISSLLFMLGNILSDLCVAIVDPRVKFGSGEAGDACSVHSRRSSGIDSNRSSAVTTRRWCWPALLAMSCAAELLVNNRALIVSYQGKLYFPTYGAVPARNNVRARLRLRNELSGAAAAVCGGKRRRLGV